MASVWQTMGMTLALGAAVAGAALAAPTESLTLPEADALALAHSPALEGLRAAGADVRAQEGEALAGYLPRLGLSSSATRGNNPVYVFGSLLEQGDFTADRFAIDKLNDPAPVNNVRTTVELGAPIFDGFSSKTASARARLGREALERRGAGAEQAIRLELLRAYFGVFLARSRLVTAERTISYAEADLAQIQQRHDQGLAVRSDLLAAEVQLREYKQSQIEAQNEVDIARAGLNLLIGNPAGAQPDLRGGLDERAFPVPDDGEAVAAALANRAELKEADLSVASARQAELGARGQYLPRVDGFAVYGLSGDTASPDSSDWLVGAKVSVALFDGGRAHRVDRARAGEALARADRARAADRVALEAVTAAGRYRSARDRMAVASGSLAQAEEALRIVGDRYREGLTPITEMLRASSAAHRARLATHGAMYESFVGYAAYLCATGQLTSVDPFLPRR